MQNVLTNSNHIVTISTSVPIKVGILTIFAPFNFNLACEIKGTRTLMVVQYHQSADKQSSQCLVIIGHITKLRILNDTQTMKILINFSVVNSRDMIMKGYENDLAHLADCNNFVPVECII